MGQNAGTSPAALSIGGDTGSTVANTEDWNGVSWVEVGDLNTAARAMGAGGTTAAAFKAGGFSGPGSALNATEEWSQGNTTKTVDTD